jgi:hypothetical protein
MPFIKTHTRNYKHNNTIMNPIIKAGKTKNICADGWKMVEKKERRIER